MRSLACNNEGARLEALRQYQIFDTSPEQAFKDLVFLASQICGTPMALINLMDANCQCLKAKLGLDIDQMPIDIGIASFCMHLGDVLVIPDTLADERFATNPVVTSYPYVRFYVGVPLMTADGEAIGALCIADRVKREISPEQVEALRAVSRLIVRQLGIQRNLAAKASMKKDISHRKLAEHQLREQAALLDIVTDAIVVRDLSNRILLWNKSAEKLYGWKTEEVMGNYAQKFFDSEPLPQHLEVYQNVLEHGSWLGELQKITKSGQEIIVESRWTLVCDEHSQPKSILVVDTDITQKKQLEKQFLRVQRMDSIGTLASGIAHDLNNVLSPILMSVQLLKAKCYDARALSMLGIVESNAKRGANLVKQVLSFARGIEGDHTVLQVKHLILEMKQIIQQTFPKSIAISTEISPDLWHVCGDSTQLHQVLMNLCLNARDAMPEGGNLKISANNIFIDENSAKIHIDARVGSYIVLTISDGGVGIPNEQLDKIFEPFFTTKEFDKGTGLGLSTVMSIIKSHGGFITVSSSVGEGTKFKVYLPAVQAATIQPVEELEIITGYGEWILVVDDDAAVREITKATLVQNNYLALTASDGIEAIALYTQYKDKISAAIIDIMMPNMDGATTISTLQKMNPLLPIITVSGLATSEKVTSAQASNLTTFLPKPYTAPELLKTLHTIINKGRG
ncbi:MAG: PAS domain S-box protein [Stigonema ocellatum SAG 48.90 = DSM 106950]|nr:PAS domain S-box protein [Stigonema ocellatum SAG 48.90 = DSM 106950]